MASFFKKLKMDNAIRKGDLRRVRELLDSGLSPNANNGGFEPPYVQTAAELGYVEIVRLLIDRGATLPSTWGGTLLHTAVRNNRPAVAAYLVEKFPSYLDHADHCRDTPLHDAARLGHIECVELLLAAGADVNARNENRRTPDMLAAEKGMAECAAMIGLYKRQRHAPPAPEPVEAWRRLDDYRVAHVTIDKSVGYRVTDIFNFAVGERTVITQNLATKSESTAVVPFQTTDRAIVLAALAELRRQGSPIADSACKGLPPPLKLPRRAG